ncbi:C6 zinc finger domain-containing protein, partial [Dactylonectria macrodidyma]
MHVSPSASASSSRSQASQSRVPPLLPEVDLELDHPSPSPSSAVWRLNLDVNYRVGTDRILQWPVFQNSLSSLRQSSFLDFNGAKALTHLNDAFNRERSPSDLLTIQRGSTYISTERLDIEQLVEQFFTRVHVKNPILNRPLVEQYCLQYYENGATFNLETCLVLLICALGAVATEFVPGGPSSDIPSENFARLESLRMGNCYFAAAEKRLAAALSCNSTLAVQCLCLAGIYHMYTINPMAALRMFHAAGSSMQVLVSTEVDSPNGTSQMNSSLFWACFKSEREILAELPISPPFLGELCSPEGYPLPLRGEYAVSGMDVWAEGDEDSWYFFLSEIALRRITDKVAEVVLEYIESPSQAALEELIPIVAEFERQAQTWREHLPLNINFPDVPRPATTEWQHYSRGRYYRVLELMYRPFIFSAVHVPGCSPTILEFANKGLINASNYLQHCHLTHRHHGLWLQLRNELKESCLLLAAARSNLEMPFGWYSGVKKTLDSFEYWRAEFPPCQSYTDVVLAMGGSSAMDEDGDMM